MAGFVHLLVEYGAYINELPASVKTVHTSTERQEQI